MIQNDLGVVIVTYHPDSSLHSLVDNLLINLSMIVIVDNHSRSENVMEMRNRYGSEKRVKLVLNSDNFGIAKGLNQGCEYLITNGYKYAVLLDQDSRISSESIETLYYTAVQNMNAAIVGPRVISECVGESGGSIESKYFTWKRLFAFKREYIKEGTVQPVELNITSGSVIDLSIWKSIKGFWESLFIQGVDDEYCLRVRKHGFQILINGDTKLNQTYGRMNIVKRLGFSFNPTNHSAERHYLVARNRVKIIRKYNIYALFYVSFHILSTAKTIVTIILTEENVTGKLLAILKGTIHGIIRKNN